MTAAALDAARLDVQSSILAKFGAAMATAEAAPNASGQARDATRIALEYAVIQTALEKDVSTSVVAGALNVALPQQRAMMVNEGRAAMKRAFGVEPELVAAAMAGKVLAPPMPRGLASNPEFERLTDSARNLVATMVQDRYANRGRFDDPGSRSDVLVVRNEAAMAKTRTDLAARLAFMESAVDAAVARGKVGPGSAQMLKERVEAMVFQPRPPQSLSYSAQFRQFYESRGMEMRREVMQDVRSVTGAQTVTEIAARLDRSMSEIDAHRRHNDLQR